MDHFKYLTGFSWIRSINLVRIFSAKFEIWRKASIQDLVVKSSQNVKCWLDRNNLILKKPSWNGNTLENSYMRKEWQCLTLKSSIINGYSVWFVGSSMFRGSTAYLRSIFWKFLRESFWIIPITPIKQTWFSLLTLSMPI